VLKLYRVVFCATDSLVRIINQTPLELVCLPTDGLPFDEPSGYDRWRHPDGSDDRTPGD